MRPPATKLLGFAPKASTAWAGDFYGTDDAVIISVPSLGEGISPERHVLHKLGG